MRKILIVDDEIEICKAFEIFLKSKGYEVCTAQDGSRALQLVREIRPQVVLLDIILPGEWGLDLLQDIKKIDPMINVIMITAIGDEETARQAKKLGAYDFITKPIDLDYLERTLLSKLVPKAARH
jgi:two-component system response regulator AtoC